MKVFLSVAKGVICAGFALVLALSNQATAQNLRPGYPPQTPGWAAVSNASLHDSSPNTASQAVAFDPNGAVIRVWDLRNPAGQPTPSIWANPGFDPVDGANVNIWSGRNLGQVFGLALDKNPNGPYIYATSTAIYGYTNQAPTTTSGTGCPTESDCYLGTADLSDPAAVNMHPFGRTGPSDNFSLTPPAGVFVTETTAAGSVPLYGAVWRLSLNADLPTAPATNGVHDPYGTYELIARIPTNKMSLGQIAYNPKVNKFYVSNFDDGDIYIFTNPPSGTAPVSSGFVKYDHGAQLSAPIPDDTNLLFTPYGRRVWGVQYNAIENKLYYAVWNADYRHQSGVPNQVWSVDLDSSGLPVAGSAVKQFDIPPYEGTMGGLPSAPENAGNVTYSTKYTQPVSDIAFNDDGTLMLVAERGERIGRNINGAYDFAATGNSTLPHNTRILRYRKSSSGWVMDTPTTGPLRNLGEYAGDTNNDTITPIVTPTSTDRYRSRTNSAGGVDFGYDYSSVVDKTTGAKSNTSIDPGLPDSWTWATVNSSETLSKGWMYGFQGAQLATMPDAGYTNHITSPSADLYFVDYDGQVGPISKMMIGDIEVHREPASLLKICKVAGDGVKVGTDFSFNTHAFTNPAVDATVHVPAGNGPDGYCVKAGIFAAGTFVAIQETTPGYTVSHISINPSTSGAYDTTKALASVALGAGVTEVTFTNEQHTGYLEICKAGDVTGMYNFDVGGQTVSVPAGACSPAIQVNAGSVVITETPVTGTHMTMPCTVFPASRIYTCDAAHNKVTVQVLPGDIANQTTVTVTNAKTDGGVHPHDPQSVTKPASTKNDTLVAQ